MKKETAFALRTGKNLREQNYPSLHNSTTIEKVKISILTFLPLDVVKEQLLHLDTSLKISRFYHLGKRLGLKTLLIAIRLKSMKLYFRIIFVKILLRINY